MFNKIQQEVDAWAQRFKTPYWKPHEILARLMEEVGELSREINHQFGPKRKKSSEEERHLEEEIGDGLFTLVCLANALKLDLDKAWRQVMDKCYGRDKDRYERR